MKLDYIIVQAGGMGKRMEALTRNKPKALVPVENLPMIFHLFRQFPDKKFIIIGDYKFDVLKKYLQAFAEMEYQLVRSSSHTGTCAGLNEALSLIPERERFMLIWCDLILPQDYTIPDSENDIIGISKDFPCRWKYEHGVFSEERSTEQGVAGHFIFQEKACLSDLPQDGELVRYLRDHQMRFEEQPLYHTREYGLFSEWSKLPVSRCRPFNRIEMSADRVRKIAIDEQGSKLAVREVRWYQKINEKGFHDFIPHIESYDPLCMERIQGCNLYEMIDSPIEKKREVLRSVVDSLKCLHDSESIPADAESYREAYLGKTFDRLQKVRDLVPFANDETVLINGRLCRNVFHHWEELEKLIMQYLPKRFVLIHGDCTFSNLMLRQDGTPVMIDPRGYFGHTELYGDAAYDWVKLYYSLFSNYDQFNLKRFSLHIQDTCVQLDVASNDWEDLEGDFFRLLEHEVTQNQMKLLLAVIWLSLTTYAWEDYDSICGAFYNGLYFFEEALRALEEHTSWDYFRDDMKIIEDALKSIDQGVMEQLLQECEQTLRAGNKIIVSGLGKNVSICDKFVGTMLSLGLNAGFLHTNSAVHGDMGMVAPGDLVIILTKSGSTSESVYLVDLLKQRKGVNLWLLSCEEHSILADRMDKKLIVKLEHEGDTWNIMPNNSTTLNLIILQNIAMELRKALGLKLERDFKPNHPGGAIGAHLRHEDE